MAGGIVLLVLSVLFGGYGMMALAESETVFQEIYGAIWVLIGAVHLVGAFIVSQIADRGRPSSEAKHRQRVEEAVSRLMEQRRRPTPPHRPAFRPPKLDFDEADFQTWRRREADKARQWPGTNRHTG